MTTINIGIDTINIDTITCPTIRACTLRFNDRCKSDNERRTRVLRPLLGVVVGARGSTELTQRRAWLGVDWAWRKALPRILGLTSLGTDWGSLFRGLPEIADAASLDTAIKAVWSMRESTSSARDYGSAMEATAATEAAGVAVMEAAVAMDAAGVAAAVTGVAAEAAEAAEAVAGMTASAVTVSPKLIAIAKAVLDQDGDYYAASAAVRVRIRATGGLVGIRPKFTALRDVLDGEFQSLIRRMVRVKETDTTDE